MEFPIEKKSLSNVDKYSKDELDIAYDFAKKIHKELDPFIKAMVLFGSVAKKRQEMPSDGIEGKINTEDKNKKGHDIDILLVVDDVALKLSKELVQTYRIIVEKMIRETDTRLHVITLKFTTFWEYIRVGDPVGMNILRDGLPIIDTGFFEPLQTLLYQGRIRPSPESIFNYFNKAPQALKNSKYNILQAIIDLYWAVIDSAHAALMKIGEVPPSPEHVAEVMERKLVKPGVVEEKYAKTMRNFYALMKGITHGELQDIKGSDYDKYFLEAEAFVKEMEKFLNRK